MSEKLRNYSPTNQFMPHRVSGKSAEFFIQDLARPATLESDTIREILKRRALRNAKAKDRKK